MQLEHSFTVPVGVDEAWQLLTDLGAIAPSMPGSKISAAAPDRVEGSLKVKLGPLNLNYSGSAALVEADADARRAVVQADGDSARNGTASATVVATLAADGEATTVTLVTELEVTGKPSQFGQNVMSDVGTRVVGQFAAALADVATARTGRSSQVTPSEPAAPEAAAEPPVEAVEPPAEAVADDPAELTDAPPAPPIKPRPRPRRDRPVEAVAAAADGAAAEGTPDAAPDTAPVPSGEADAEDVKSEDLSADDAPADDDASEDRASDEPADDRVEDAAIEAEAAGEPSAPAFAAASTLPPVTDETIPSVNGHGSPTPPTPPPSRPSRGLSDLARPALVRGVAPVTLAVLFVLGAVRRRRRG